MVERIIVCFRERASGTEAAESTRRLECIRAQLKRAEALGATVCSWGAVTFCLAFLPEDMEEAIDFVTDDDGQREREAFRIGVSQGEITPMVEFRGSMELARGVAVRRALALSRAADKGEVVVDAHMEAVQLGKIWARRRRSARAGRFRVRGRLLDSAQPWNERGSHSESIPPESKDMTSQWESLPTLQGGPAVSRADQAQEQVEPVARPDAQGQPVERELGEASPSPQENAVTTPPEQIAESEGEEERPVAILSMLALEAMLAGDISALERWVKCVPMTEQRGRLLDRVRAIVALGSGDKGAALRVLRDGCERSAGYGLVEQCRSHLAHAVGLARTGHDLGALVEGLKALARARQSRVQRAERACVLFLRNIYEAAGYGEDATQWTKTMGSEGIGQRA